MFGVRKRLENAAGAIFGLSAVAALVSAIGEIGYWLKYGFWPDWSIGKDASYPKSTGYFGVDRIVAWLYDLPIPYIYLIVSFIFFLIWAHFINRDE